MRRIGTILLSCSLLMASIGAAGAHPGRTDGNGGHTCRTNCEKWGLQYGQYHYHHGGGASSGGGGTSAPKPAATQQKSPVLPMKTIVAVDQAPVLLSPYGSEITGTLWYGYEVKDQGSLYDGFVQIEQGYLSKNLLTQYAAIKPKAVNIATEKAYFFSIPHVDGKVRGTANKQAVVHVVGENNGFYFGSTTDVNGKVLVGFVSKTVIKQ